VLICPFSLTVEITGLDPDFELRFVSFYIVTVVD